MKYLALLTAAFLLSNFLPTQARAGGAGYRVSGCNSCAVSKFQTPRYFQTLPYRHFDDRRRYNAAPCCGEYVPQRPYLVNTVIVRKKREPLYTYDSHGNRFCRRVLVTTYKDIYSDGSCRVWTKHG